MLNLICDGSGDLPIDEEGNKVSKKKSNQSMLDDSMCIDFLALLQTIQVNSFDLEMNSGAQVEELKSNKLNEMVFAIEYSDFDENNMGLENDISLENSEIVNSEILYAFDMKNLEKSPEEHGAFLIETDVQETDLQKTELAKTHIEKAVIEEDTFQLRHSLELPGLDQSEEVEETSQGPIRDNPNNKYPNIKQEFETEIKDLLSGREQDDGDERSIECSYEVLQSPHVDTKKSNINVDFSLNDNKEQIANSISTDTYKSEILNQVVKKVESFKDDEKAEMTIELKPESLGKLSLKVVTEKGIVAASFIAENDQVKEVLETNMQMLKDVFEKQGISVQGFSVSVGDQSSNNSKREERMRQERISGIKRKINTSAVYANFGEVIVSDVQENDRKVEIHELNGRKIDLKA
jgi:hypothetical protein